MEGMRLERKKQLEQERIFQEFVTGLSAGLRAGYSLPNGFEEAVLEMVHLHGEKSLLIKELKRVNRGMKEGRKCEEMLTEAGHRLGCQTMLDLSEVLGIVNLIGGDRTKILEQTNRLLQSKNNLRQEIEDSISGRIFEAKIMEMIPFFIVLYIEMGNPGFYEVLYKGIYGRAIMILCMTIYIVAKLWMHCIVNKATEGCYV